MDVNMTPNQLLRRWTWLFLGGLIDALVFLAIGTAMLLFMPAETTIALLLLAIGGIGAAACAGAAMNCLNKIAQSGMQPQRRWFAVLGNNSLCRLLAGVEFISLALVLLVFSAKALGFHITNMKF